MGSDIASRMRSRTLTAEMVPAIDLGREISLEIKIDYPVWRYDNGKFSAIMLD